MGEQKFRHELKHYINLSDYFALRHRLRVVTKPDGNSGIDGTYKVRSLYFDNIYDKVLREKIDGLNNREKFRIRIYDNDDSYIRLEKKSKKNGLCSKESILISKEECMKLTTVFVNIVVAFSFYVIYCLVPYS